MSWPLLGEAVNWQSNPRNWNFRDAQRQSTDHSHHGRLGDLHAVTALFDAHHQHSPKQLNLRDSGLLAHVHHGRV